MDLVYVSGHKNPDTDSICAAISYAYLKNQLGEREYVPKRAGAIAGVIVGLLVIAWMSLSPFINEGSPFYEFRSPFHTYLTIVFGTTSIFLTGFIITKLCDNKEPFR